MIAAALGALLLVAVVTATVVVGWQLIVAIACIAAVVAGLEWCCGRYVRSLENKDERED